MRLTANATSRPDAQIFIEARHALDQRHTVPGSVRVHVDEGMMTLTGSVRWLFERSEAEDAVRPIQGVRRLVNNITVAQIPSAAGFEPPDDRE